MSNQKNDRQYGSELPSSGRSTGFLTSVASGEIVGPKSLASGEYRATTGSNWAKVSRRESLGTSLLSLQGHGGPYIVSVKRNGIEERTLTVAEDIIRDFEVQ